MTENSIHFRSSENSYVDTIIMKLLKSSIEKENDDHDVFGAYVSMEMRNLKTPKAQERLRTEIRDAISRVIRDESNIMNDISTCYPNSIKTVDKHEELDHSSGSLESNNNCDDSSTGQNKIRKTSWELIN